MAVSGYFLPRMRNVSHKSCRENQTHIWCSITCFRKSCRLWDNVKKYGGARGATNDVTIWRIRVACWISNATRLHTPTPLRHTHARTHSRAHTQTNMSYLLLFHGNNDSRTRLSVTLYVHCLSCFFVVRVLAWFSHVYYVMPRNI